MSMATSERSGISTGGAAASSWLLRGGSWRLELLDPAFWELFWFELTDPDAGSAAELLLVGAIEQLPVIGPLLVGFGKTAPRRCGRLARRGFEAKVGIPSPATRVPPLPRDWEPACKASTTRRSRG